MSIRLTPTAKDLFQKFTPVRTNPKPAEVTASAPKEKVTARLESLEEGVCPYCHQPMRKSSIELGEVWLCEGDRHVVPMRNA